jgi:ATP-dependent Lhr-like helicase
VGRPPRFGGDSGAIHDRVVEKMKEVLSDADLPVYLDERAACLLEDARSEFRRLDIVRRSICEIGERSSLIATWKGTIKNSTFALALQAMGYTVATYDGFLDIQYEEGIQPVESALEEIARSAPVSADRMLSGKENLMTEKFHPYLSSDLLL